jgi:hypothetical protein
MMVKLESSNNVVFTLAGKDVDATNGIQLSAIRVGGAKADLKKGEVSQFKIKLKTNGSNAGTSDVTVKVIYKGTELASKNLKWKDKDVKFKFNAPADNHEFKADGEVDIIVENDGDKVHTDEMMVKLESSNNVVFTLAGKDVHATNGIQLSAIRVGGAKTDLKKGEVSQFKIKLKTNADNKTTSDVTVKIMYKGTELLASKNLLWKDNDVKDVKVAFTDPGAAGKIFIGVADYRVELENKKDQVNTDDLLVKLTSSEKDVKFKLGEVEVNTTGKTLTAILGVGAADLNKNATKDFNLKLVDANGKVQSTVTLEVFYKGQKLATRQITWKDKGVKVAFTAPVDDLQILKGTADYRVELQNAEDQVNTDDLLVKLISSEKDVKFKLGAVEVNHTGKTLTQILGVGAADLNKNATKDFNLKLVDANGKVQSTVTLMVLYKGQKLATRKITWEQ